MDTDREAALNACRNLPQYAFQRRYILKGDRVLNVGCDIDCGLLRYDFDAVNMDVNSWSGANNCPTAADVIHDAREPFQMAPLPIFDCVVIGDVLEHFTDEDAIKIITNARDVLKPGGKIVITCPEDHRTQAEQREFAEHVPGVPKHHPRPITADIITGWVVVCGLKVRNVQKIQYGFCEGWGVCGRKVDNES